MIDQLIELMKSSIEKSVELKLFKNVKDSTYAHVYDYKMEKISISKFKKNNIKYFDSKRLKSKSIEEAYPENNRPKGEYNIKSVEFHSDLIKKNVFPLIWVVCKNKEYYLIHGSHKIVASHLEKLKKIDAYVVYI